MLMLDGLYTFCNNNRLPPVCRAFAIISLHLSLMESEVTGARGNVLINVLGVTSVASLLLLELLLELLWDQSETTTWTSIHVDHQEERPPGCFFFLCMHLYDKHFLCCLFLHHYLDGMISSYLSSFASGLPCDGDTTGVVCSFLLSSEGLSPPPGSSGAQGKSHICRKLVLKLQLQNVFKYRAKTSSINMSAAGVVFILLIFTHQYLDGLKNAEH